MILTYFLLGLMAGYMLSLSDVEQGKPLPHPITKWRLYVFVIVFWPIALWRMSAKIFLDNSITFHQDKNHE